MAHGWIRTCATFGRFSWRHCANLVALVALLPRNVGHARAQLASSRTGSAFELGLPAAKDVEGFVTWHFDFSPKGTFVTVGPVPFPPNAGGPNSYPQTLAGASGPFPKATVTSLSADGFQFRIKLPGG